MAKVELDEVSPSPDAPARPAPGLLGDFGFLLLGAVWAVVVIAVGAWLQTR